MENLQNLIESALAGGADGFKAANRLGEVGAPALPFVLRAIERAGLNAGPICRLLLKLRDRQLVPEFIRLLDSDNSRIRTTAYHWMAHCNEPLAFEALRERLLSEVTWPAKKALAAEALGTQGNPLAIEPLRTILRKSPLHKTTPDAISKELSSQKPDDSTLGLWIDASVALAKLGIQETAPLILGIIRYGRRADVDGFSFLVKAITALQSMAGRGVLQTLSDVLTIPASEGEELAELALRGLFLLGAGEIVPPIIALIERDPESYLVDLALSHLYRVTGEWPLGMQSAADLNVGALEDWWKERATSFKHGICYRMGKPLSLPDVIGELGGDPNFIGWVAEELHVITGNDFDYDSEAPAEEQHLLEKATRWWSEAGNRFTPGSFYKYGFKQELTAAIAPA